MFLLCLLFKEMELCSLCIRKMIQGKYNMSRWHEFTAFILSFINFTVISTHINWAPSLSQACVMHVGYTDKYKIAPGCTKGMGERGWEQFQGHMVREPRSGPEPLVEIKVLWVKHRVWWRGGKEGKTVELENNGMSKLKSTIHSFQHTHTFFETKMFVSLFGTSFPTHVALVMDLTHWQASSGLSHRHHCVSWALSEHSTTIFQHPIFQGGVLVDQFGKCWPRYIFLQLSHMIP